MQRCISFINTVSTDSRIWFFCRIRRRVRK